MPLNAGWGERRATPSDGSALAALRRQLLFAGRLRGAGCGCLPARAARHAPGPRAPLQPPPALPHPPRLLSPPWTARPLRRACSASGWAPLTAAGPALPAGKPAQGRGVPQHAQLSAQEGGLGDGCPRWVWAPAGGFCACGALDSTLACAGIMPARRTYVGGKLPSVAQCGNDGTRMRGGA